MGRTFSPSADESGRLRPAPVPGAEVFAPPADAHASAVSWGAIFAGAAAAAAASMILLMLGVGLGLSSVSPWARDGASATTLSVSSIVWVTFTQLAASALGGYLAGRLRTRWVAVHSDEVHFRDTAHGFLAWAIASLVTASLLASVATSIVGGSLQTGAQLMGGAAVAGTQVAATAQGSNGNEAGDNTPLTYFAETLFRQDAASGAAAPVPTTPAPTAEVGRIFLGNLPATSLPEKDLRYVGQLVAQRTGLAPAEAEKRVTDAYAGLQTRLQTAKTNAQEAIDKARKASAFAALWLFIALLMGAFVASWIAPVGGRQRDL